jgi:hypothetical protein
MRDESVALGYDPTPVTDQHKFYVRTIVSGSSDIPVL